MTLSEFIREAVDALAEYGDCKLEIRLRNEARYRVAGTFFNPRVEGNAGVMMIDVLGAEPERDE